MARRQEKNKCGHLAIEYTIYDRPKSAESRQIIGHRESDTVRGAKWTSCIATHVERASRYAVLRKIPNRTTDALTSATVEFFLRIPKRKRRSFYVEHGKEYANYREML